MNDTLDKEVNKQLSKSPAYDKNTRAIEKLRNKNAISKPRLSRENNPMSDVNGITNDNSYLKIDHHRSEEGDNIPDYKIYGKKTGINLNEDHYGHSVSRGSDYHLPDIKSNQNITADNRKRSNETIDNTKDHNFNFDFDNNSKQSNNIM